MAIANNSDGPFIIDVRFGSEHQIYELWKWVDEHWMTVNFLGDHQYAVVGEDDSLLFKLRWG